MLPTRFLELHTHLNDLCNLNAGLACLENELLVFIPFLRRLVYSLVDLQHLG